MAKKVERPSELDAEEDESGDTEPEQIGVGGQRDCRTVDGADKDVDHLSEGEIFVPKKRQRTAKMVKPSKEKSSGLPQAPKPKSGRTKKKLGSQNKLKNVKTGQDLSLVEDKSKPLNLRTAVWSSLSSLLTSVASKANGAREYCITTNLAAFSRAWPSGSGKLRYPEASIVRIDNRTEVSRQFKT